MKHNIPKNVFHLILLGIPSSLALSVQNRGGGGLLNGQNMLTKYVKKVICQLSLRRNISQSLLIPCSLSDWDLRYVHAPCSNYYFLVQKMELKIYYYCLLKFCLGLTKSLWHDLSQKSTELTTKLMRAIVLIKISTIQP